MVRLEITPDLQGYVDLLQTHINFFQSTLLTYDINFKKKLVRVLYRDIS